MPKIIMNREDWLLQSRPAINLDLERESLEVESFQNETLRPILKLQHDWIMSFFKWKTKGLIMPEDFEERNTWIKNLLQKDTLLRNQLLGGLLGLLTLTEFQFYQSNADSINKRLIQMLIQRILSQI